MAYSATFIPAYSRHNARHKAYVRLDGKVIYLPGVYGSPESKAEYNRLVGRWQLNGRQLPSDATAPAKAIPTAITQTVSSNQSAEPSYLIVNLINDYLDHMERTFPSINGKRHGEVGNMAQAFKSLAMLYGKTPAATFGPKALRIVRDMYVQNGLCRKTCNRYTAYCKRMMKWAN